MASFASEVKNELARLYYKEHCCAHAELVALIRLSGAVFMDKNKLFGLKFTAKNAAVARKTLTLIREENSKIPVKVSMSKSTKLSKKSSYNIVVLPSEESQKLISSLEFIAETVKKSCCKSAYLRGAFLATGTVNKPESEYHLEFSTVSDTFAKFLLELMRKLDFPAKITDRKDEYIVYLKTSDAILDFLYMTGAEFAAEKFEAARNLKEVRSQVNRIVNCETANLDKTVAAAVKQSEYIKALKKADVLDTLKKELQDTARVRLQNPEASLKELAELLFVSKSALAHRMKKLKMLAEKL